MLLMSCVREPAFGFFATLLLVVTDVVVLVLTLSIVLWIVDCIETRGRSKVAQRLSFDA